MNMNEQYIPIVSEVLESVIEGRVGASEIRTHSGLNIYLKEPEHLRKIFKKSDLPFLILVSGPSESGKSTWGINLFREGIATRYKILKCVRTLLEEKVFGDNRNTNDPVAFINATMTEDVRHRAAVVRNIVARITQDLRSWDTPIAVVESMSSAWLTTGICKDPEVRALSVFIHPLTQQRIHREAVKEGITLDEASVLVGQKDRTKSNAGVWAIRSTCHILVENGGKLSEHEAFIKQVGTLALKSCPKFGGKPVEYK